ncbi:S41 family peptidase [Niabella ginsengisoli]|uniref:S41 family peptidase n=1 Tax=Niabella ginsengisoli TaxID=522298 RepID=A0ABS9SNQ3_9BACT|nr:S41 family peptidase [Niabella ginsengisoli]MCH5600013.1 S41 family peptidase [Niabella ginsengisoli]
MQQDYELFQNILEERHPSLYWYTPKSAMDSAFSAAKLQLTDSLTEYSFRKILQPVVALINCGHTSVRVSKSYQKYIDKAESKTTFPFQVKTWNDTVVFVATNKKNVDMKRGDIISSINGKPVKVLLDTIRRYIPADGGNGVAKDQLLSFGTNFGSFYSSLLGWQKEYNLSLTDSLGKQHNALFSMTSAVADTSRKAPPQKKIKKEKIPKQQRLKQQRHFEIKEGYALMEVNSFSEKLQLKKFFRQSFRTLEKQQVQNLVIDLRLNGGGRLNNFIFLARYLIDHPYKICDSLYTISRSSNYGRYIENNFLNSWQILFSTKNRNGKYHYRYFEKHRYQPKKQKHFDGNIYLLSSGYTASASTLALSALKGQSNVTIVGEPSGGAAYGATAWIIPDVTMPNTKVRFRLPLFRMVIDKTLPQNGRGVQPDIFAGPSVEAIRKGEDFKMKKVIGLINRPVK